MWLSSVGLFGDWVAAVMASRCLPWEMHPVTGACDLVTPQRSLCKACPTLIVPSAFRGSGRSLLRLLHLPSLGLKFRSDCAFDVVLYQIGFGLLPADNLPKVPQPLARETRTRNGLDRVRRGHWAVSAGLRRSVETGPWATASSAVPQQGVEPRGQRVLHS